MEIIDDVIDDIQANAFDKYSFNETIALILSMPLKILRTDAFTGLVKLITLRLNKTRIHKIETNFINSPQLQTFSIAATNSSIELIHRLTDALPENCRSIRINNNDKFNVIKKNSFSKFHVLETLTLIHNKIAHIENQSFHSFAKTLRFLYLRGNRLKTLPDGIIPIEILSQEGSTRRLVALHNNPWHCSCELQYLKDIHIKYPLVFISNLNCETPLRLKNKQIIDVDLCDEANEDDSSDQCRSKIGLMQPNSDLHVVSTASGELSLLVNFTSTNNTLIWLENSPLDQLSTNNMPKCIKSSRTQKANLNLGEMLKSGKVYTFCLLKKPEGRVHPLNCISHYTSPSTTDNNWVKKTLGFLTLFVVYALAACIGTALVFLYNFVRNRFKKKPGNILSIDQLNERKNFEWFAIRIVVAVFNFLIFIQ